MVIELRGYQSGSFSQKWCTYWEPDCRLGLFSLCALVLLVQHGLVLEASLRRRLITSRPRRPSRHTAAPPCASRPEEGRKDLREEGPRARPGCSWGRYTQSCTRR
eukprot:262245-Prymnesium_polylepis.1